MANSRALNWRPRKKKKVESFLKKCLENAEDEIDKFIKKYPLMKEVKSILKRINNNYRILSCFSGFKEI